MSYSIQCNDLFPGCEGVVEADTREGVMAKAAAHAAEVHGLTELDGETMAAVEGAVRVDA